MTGILEKHENLWFIKWTDLHSFTNGWEWIFTPVHESVIIDETYYKENDEVEFEFSYEVGFGFAPRFAIILDLTKNI